MMIRTETANDFKNVYQLNYEAFGNREDEARLVERIRHSKGFVSGLSIVSEEDGDITGHLLLSKAEIIDQETSCEVIVLAPIAVRPDLQKKGIGTKLINEGLKRCAALGFYVVCLIGHPTYYPRFGFKQARSCGLELKQFDVPDEVFMVCELREGELNNINGELRYPESFFG
jgi:putative acetyltransferase